MTEREKSCCFIGHRHVPEEDRQRLAESLARAVEKLAREGMVYFGVGESRGFDAMAAEAVLKLRRRYRQIQLVLVLSCREPEEDLSWWEDRRRRRLERLADQVVCVQQEYTRDCMQKRNRCLVDSSSVCVAYCFRSSGNAAQTLDYARQEGVRVIPL